MCVWRQKSGKSMERYPVTSVNEVVASEKLEQLFQLEHNCWISCKMIKSNSIIGRWLAIAYLKFKIARIESLGFWVGTFLVLIQGFFRLDSFATNIAVKFAEWMLTLHMLVLFIMVIEPFWTKMALDGATGSMLLLLMLHEFLFGGEYIGAEFTMLWQLFLMVVFLVSELT